MSESVLVTPFEVVSVLIDVVKRLHPQHLAKLERQKSLEPQTLERLATVSHLANQDRLAGDKLPACLVGVVGPASAPSLNEDGKLDVSLQIGVSVTVVGRGRAETLQRRDWTGFTVAECLLQRTPRRGPILGLQWTDFEAVENADEQRFLAEMRMIFEVGVPNMMTVSGGLPADDTPWPAGGPNGPPSTAYGVPEGSPEADEVGFTVGRDPAF